MLCFKIRAEAKSKAGQNHDLKILKLPTKVSKLGLVYNSRQRFGYINVQRTQYCVKYKGRAQNVIRLLIIEKCCV